MQFVYLCAAGEVSVISQLYRVTRGGDRRVPLKDRLGLTKPHHLRVVLSFANDVAPALNSTPPSGIARLASIP